MNCTNAQSDATLSDLEGCEQTSDSFDLSLTIDRPACSTSRKTLKLVAGLFRRKADWELCLDLWEAEEKRLKSQK